MTTGDFRLTLRPDLIERVKGQCVSPYLDRLGVRWERLAKKAAPKGLTKVLSSTVYHLVSDGELHVGSEADYTVAVHEGHHVNQDPPPPANRPYKTNGFVPGQPFIRDTMMEAFNATRR